MMTFEARFLSLFEANMLPAAIHKRVLAELYKRFPITGDTHIQVVEAKSEPTSTPLPGWLQHAAGRFQTVEQPPDWLRLRMGSRKGAVCYAVRYEEETNTLYMERPYLREE